MKCWYGEAPNTFIKRKKKTRSSHQDWVVVVLARTTRLFKATSVLVHSAQSLRISFWVSGLAKGLTNLNLSSVILRSFEVSKLSKYPIRTQAPSCACCSTLSLHGFKLLVDVLHVVGLDFNLLCMPQPVQHYSTHKKKEAHNPKVHMRKPFEAGIGTPGLDWC